MTIPVAQTGAQGTTLGTGLQITDLNKVFTSGRKSVAALQDANLHKARFDRANFQATKLTGQDFSQCSFVEANLRKAHLQDTTLAQVDFTQADLRETKLMGADFYKVNLTDADLRAADLRHTVSISRSVLKSALTNDKTLFHE